MNWFFQKRANTREISKVIIAPFLLRKRQIMESPTSNKVQIQKSFVTQSVEVSVRFYSVNGMGSLWQGAIDHR